MYANKLINKHKRLDMTRHIFTFFWDAWRDCFCLWSCDRRADTGTRCRPSWWSAEPFDRQSTLKTLLNQNRSHDSKFKYSEMTVSVQITKNCLMPNQLSYLFNSRPNYLVSKGGLNNNLKDKSKLWPNLWKSWHQKIP